MEVSNNYINEVKEILKNARQKAYNTINSVMVEAYWKIGRRIVEEEQSGRERAEYGKEIIKNLSKELTEEFGKGFSRRTLVYNPETWKHTEYYFFEDAPKEVENSKVYEVLHISQ